VYTVCVTVEGTGRGLLMHKFSPEAEAEMEAKVKKAVRKALPPAEEAEKNSYRLDPQNGEKKGQLMLPAEHFLGCLLASGSSFKIQGARGKTYKDAFAGNLDVQPDYVPLADAEGKALFGYGIDARPVRNPSTRGRVMRYRPHLKAGWRASFCIQVSDDTIPLEVIQAGLEIAGRSKCVGDYRPRFGTFRIVRCEKEAGGEAA
jgi:hypothetical protein